MNTSIKADVLSLSVPERIQLVEDIWNSIADHPDALPLSDEKKGELDRRFDAYRKYPNEGSDWETVQERVRSKE